MPILRRVTVFLTGILLLTATSRAQTPLGQPTLDEQKVQVWCATARFVYEDNGRPNLKSTLRCGSSLKEFENSIRADSQRVFSALYQPLEGRGAIYKGLGSNPSRLQKLKTEIISRLKSSPARRASPARMQRLAALETALATYVQNGTPISAQPEDAPETPAADALDTDEAAPGPPPDAGPEEAGIAQPAETTRGAGESLINKFFAPLALIMALLSLVLYALMRRNLAVFQQELSARLLQRQEEMLASRSAAATSAAAPEAVFHPLSPELRREVEQLVAQRVAAELARRELPPAPALGSYELPAAGPFSGATSAPPVAAVATELTAPPADTAPAPATGVADATEAAPPAPTALEVPGSLTEIAAPPLVLPAGSPATALRDDFDSLVPPVHLPDSVAAEASSTRYSPAPVRGVFQDAYFSEELESDSVYEIYRDAQWPELATFQVSIEPEVQAYLLQSAPPDLLADACAYEQPTGPVTRIVTEEEGILRKVEGTWHIEQQALVRFKE